MKNPYAKRTTRDQPYFESEDRYGWKFCLLKLNQAPDKALKNPYASGLIATFNPDFNAWSEGNAYISSVPGLKAHLASLARQQITY